MDRLRKDYLARLQDLKLYLLDIFKELFANSIGFQQVLLLVNQRLSDQRQHLLLQQDVIIKSLEQQNLKLRQNLSQGKWQRQLSQKDKQLLQLHELGLKYQQAIEHLDSDSATLSEAVVKLQARLMIQIKQKEVYQKKIKQLSHQNQLIISNLQSQKNRAKQLQIQLKNRSDNQELLVQQNQQLKAMLKSNQSKAKKSQFEQAIENVHKRVLVHSKPNKQDSRQAQLKNRALQLLNQIRTIKCQFQRLKSALTGSILQARHSAQRCFEQMFSKSVRQKQKQVGQISSSLSIKFQNQIKSLNQKCDKQNQLIRMLQQQNQASLHNLREEGDRLRILSSQFLILQNQLQYSRQQVKDAEAIINQKIPCMIAQRDLQALQNNKQIEELKSSLSISNSLKLKLGMENNKLKESINTLANVKASQAKSRHCQLLQSAGQLAKTKRKQVIQTRKCQLQQLNNIAQIRERYLRI